MDWTEIDAQVAKLHIARMWLRGWTKACKNLIKRPISADKIDLALYLMRRGDLASARVTREINTLDELMRGQ